MHAMIFAAGLGTRLRPLTDKMPKAMVPVAGKPLLCHVIDKVRAAGIERIVVNVHHKAEQIVDYLKAESGVAVSDETDLLRETGGALRHATPLLKGSGRVLVHNVDILSNIDLRALMREAEGTDALLLVSQRDTQRYLLFDDDMRLVGWTNIKTGEVKSPHTDLDVTRCHRYAFAGIHVISEPLIDEMASWDERFSIIDFYLAKCADHRIHGFLAPDLRLLDVGKIDSLAEAEEFVKDIPLTPSAAGA